MAHEASVKEKRMTESTEAKQPDTCVKDNVKYEKKNMNLFIQ